MPAKTFWIEDWWPFLLVALLALGWLIFSVIAVLSARQKRRHRPVRAALLIASAPVALSLLVLTALLLVQFGAYQALTEWEVAARVKCGTRGRHGEFKLVFTTLAGGQERASRTFDVYGDEWLIRADVVRWKPFMRRLGLTRSFKFSHLEGVYHRRQDSLEHPLTSETIGRGTDRMWLRVHSLRTPWPFRYFINSAYTASVSAPTSWTDLYDIIGTKEGLTLRKVDY